MNFMSIIGVGDNYGYTEMIIDKEVKSSLYHYHSDEHPDIFGFWYDYSTIEVSRIGIPYNRLLHMTTEYQFPYNLLPDGAYFKYCNYYQGRNFYIVYFLNDRQKIETILELNGFEIT